MLNINKANQAKQVSVKLCLTVLGVVLTLTLNPPLPRWLLPLKGVG